MEGKSKRLSPPYAYKIKKILAYVPLVTDYQFYEIKMIQCFLHDFHSAERSQVKCSPSNFCGVDVLSEENGPLAASMEGNELDYVSSDGLYLRTVRTVFQDCQDCISGLSCVECMVRK